MAAQPIPSGMRVCMKCREVLPLDYYRIVTDVGKPMCQWCEDNPKKSKQAEGALQSRW